MCTNVQTRDGKEFACRVCDECLQARKNGWVARAMAERSHSQHCLLIRLSYRNKRDGSKPDGARIFIYAHVSAFLKRLRRAYAYKYGRSGEIRFLVVGEQGSEKGRVHWHMVLFSQEPLEPLGKWFDFNFRKTPFPEYEQNVHWSYWEHGHVYLQVPDQGGMYYALKYIVKDQFTGLKARGTKRERGSLTHAAALFRMSKKPPIGWTYLEEQISKWWGRLSVPPHLRLNVPDLHGYWYPTGKMREYLLAQLFEINQESLRVNGRPCLQWSSLLASDLRPEEWESLVYGEEKEVFETFDEWDERAKIDPELSRVRAKCGKATICDDCSRIVGGEASAWFDGWRKQFEAGLRPEYKDYKTFDAYWRAKRLCNPFCQKIGEPSRLRAFDRRQK